MRLRTLRFCIVVYALLYFGNKVEAQCPGGASPLTATYSTSEHINFGDASSTYNFPQFNPALGTLLQVDIQATINGEAVDFLENNLNTSTAYTVQAVRYDSIFGPSLVPALAATSTKNYGPFVLGASDNLGVPNFSGPDFIQLGPDVLPNNKILSQSFNKNKDLLPYVGTGNVSFNYKSSARAIITGSANNTNTIAASTDITMEITYTYCAVSLLPIENLQFNAKKDQGRNVKVNWVKQKEQANIIYEVQVSTDGKVFQAVNTVPSKVISGEAQTNYEYLYSVPDGISGNVLFRLKQTQFSGAVDYSDIISVIINLNDKKSLGISVFPNPARQDIYLQFSSVPNSTLIVSLINSVGQLVENIRLNGNSETVKISLKRQYEAGVYFINVKNTITGEQTTSRILIR
ncbi:MAG: hypothetical protein C5B52_03250 [Bacteroidetes bacterium]|nr:MAG: hypothetical protein C5B52_03250 [Bacteroidota bacterium]